MNIAESLWRVGLALAAGAFLTFAVAWGSAYFFPLPQFTAQSQSSTSRSWVGSVPASLGEPDRAVLGQSPVASHWQLQWDGPDSSNYDDDCVSNIYHHGFPIRSMQSVHIGNGRASSFNYDGPVSKGHLPMPPGQEYFMDTGRQYASFLPLYPLWRGFILSTVFYAVVSALTWMAITRSCGRLRGRRRVRMGLCRHCGYPMSEPACPECGSRTR